MSIVFRNKLLRGKNWRQFQSSDEKTQDPHPDPEHSVGNDGRKQEPRVNPVLTWHVFFKHVTSHTPVKYILNGQFGIYIFLLFL